MSQAMTFAQIRQAVVDSSQRVDKISVINTGINLGLSEISQLYDWRDLRVQVDININPNDLSFPLPADFYQIVDVRLINGALSYPLVLIPKDKFTRMWANVSALGSGRPWTGYEELGTLYFAPMSAGAYPMRTTYIRLHPQLQFDSDQPLIQTVNMALVAYACWYLYMTIGMLQDAASWRQTFEGEVQRAIVADQRRPGIILQSQEYSTDANVIRTSVEPWLDPFAGHD